MKMTSAYANKMIKQLTEEKSYWMNRESEGSTYVAAMDEEPVIPQYDYIKVSKEIADIDEKVIKIKHALNTNNVNSRITVGDKEMSVDEILIAVAQYNTRKRILDYMRKQEPKTRVGSSSFSARKSVPEYKYLNYDLDLIKEEYKRIDEEIAAMQIALDKYNQTFEFEVNI